MRMVKVPAGKYVVAVSGGVDSMALLNMLLDRPDLQLLVAHVNHGIRSDSKRDEALVRLFCMSHNIRFVSKVLNLGANASEETARKARYEFLQHCRKSFKATAIITAHHQDDLLETAVINLLRGTGWRGIAPFGQQNVLRPLVNNTKKTLVKYAKEHSLPWREDSTNANQNYLRNYVRHSLMPAMNKIDRQWGIDLLRLIRKQLILRRKIEAKANSLLQILAQSEPNKLTIRRYFLIMLPHAVAYEIMQTIFRNLLGFSLTHDLAEQALLFAKTALPAKNMPLDSGWQLRVTKSELIVEQRARMLS
jgi:tRNA(Ile)-lysidine synthase